MTAKELRDKFEQDLADLQGSCEHERCEWMDYAWAPGHFSGRVKTCLNCEMILEKS